MKKAITDATVYVFRDGHHVPEETNIFIADGRIVKLCSEQPDESYEVCSKPGTVIIPAAYDTHIHGGGRLARPSMGLYDFDKGEFVYSEENVLNAFSEMFRSHARHGTGYINFSFAALPFDKLEAGLRLIRQWQEDAPTDAAILKGVDFESNFFCDADNGGYSGAQDKRYFIKPEIDTFKRYQDLCGDQVRRVGIGFEWDQLYPDEKPAQKFAEYLRDQGIVIGVGHSGAKERILKDVMMQGGQFSYIHLGNGLNKINLRPDQARPFESVADCVAFAERNDRDLYAEMILDGVHLDRRFILWTNYMFGKERIIGVTDNSGISEPVPCKTVNFGKARAVITPENPDALWVEGKVGEVLCGSMASVERLLNVYISVMTDPGPDGEGIRPYFLREYHAPQPLPDAIDWTIFALSSNPARLYGMSDIGAIQPGKEASLMVLNIDESPSKIKVTETWIRGRTI